MDPSFFVDIIEGIHQKKRLHIANPWFSRLSFFFESGGVFLPLPRQKGGYKIYHAYVRPGVTGRQRKKAFNPPPHPPKKKFFFPQIKFPQVIQKSAEERGEKTLPPSSSSLEKKKFFSHPGQLGRMRGRKRKRMDDRWVNLWFCGEESLPPPPLHTHTQIVAIFWAFREISCKDWTIYIFKNLEWVFTVQTSCLFFYRKRTLDCRGGSDWGSGTDKLCNYAQWALVISKESTSDCGNKIEEEKTQTTIEDGKKEPREKKALLSAFVSNHQKHENYTSVATTIIISLLPPPPPPPPPPLSPSYFHPIFHKSDPFLLPSLWKSGKEGEREIPQILIRTHAKRAMRAGERESRVARWPTT